MKELKKALDKLDDARLEHAKRVAHVVTRMRENGDTLGEASSFVGLGASREREHQALQEMEIAARKAVESLE